MIEVLYTVGLPASGKTTFAKKWVQEDPLKRVRINKDDLRSMVGPYWLPKREDFIDEIEDSLVAKAVENNYSVIIDATNFQLDDESVLESIGLEIYGKKFLLDEFCYKELKDKLYIRKIDFTHIDPLECIRRNKLRDQQVPEEVIIKMAKKYLNMNINGWLYKGYKDHEHLESCIKGEVKPLISYVFYNYIELKNFSAKTSEKWKAIYKDYISTYEKLNE